jgi:hypothetical protein
MKRSFAALAAMAVSVSMGLATTPAYANPAHAKRGPKPQTASLLTTPQWTYSDGGEFAITAKCSASKDLRVIFSPLLYRPVAVPAGGKVLMRVTGKTKPGKYHLGLECVSHSGQVGAVAFRTLTVRKQLSGWSTVSPGLPRHFKPDLTVQTSVSQVIVTTPSHR